MQIATLRDGLGPEEQRLFIDPAVRAYNDYVHKSALKLIQLAGEQSWRPTQISFWRDFIPPTTGTTAVFLIDALRFDLAQRLIQLLADDGYFDTAITWRWATIPSYTDLGMAALLPKAEAGSTAILTSDGLKAVSYTHLDVYKRQVAEELRGQGAGPWSGQISLTALAQEAMRREGLIRQRLAEIECDIDKEVYRLYGISPEDQRMIAAELAQLDDTLSDEIEMETVEEAEPDSMTEATLCLLYTSRCV